MQTISDLTSLEVKTAQVLISASHKITGLMTPLDREFYVSIEEVRKEFGFDSCIACAEFHEWEKYLTVNGVVTPVISIYFLACCILRDEYEEEPKEDSLIDEIISIHLYLAFKKAFKSQFNVGN